MQYKTAILNKTMILTPEQKAALDGPERQFVIGAAGTGKTVILQLKALELLQKGKSVFIFCPPWFATKYKQLFDEYKFTRYWIETSWIKLSHGFRHFDDITNVKENIAAYAYEVIARALDDCTMRKCLQSANFTKLLSEYDGLFIDDMLDRYAWSLKVDEDNPVSSGLRNTTADILFSLTLMAFAKLVAPLKTVWVACEFWMDHEHYFYVEDYKKKTKLIKEFLNPETKNLASMDEYYKLTKLNRVMRCPQNVFEAAYAFGNDGYGPVVKPLLGHKIQGKIEKITIPCNSEEEGWQLVWGRLRIVLNRLSAKGIRFDNICIISGGAWRSYREEFMLQKCEENGIPARTMLNFYPLVFEYTSCVGDSSPEKGILTIRGPYEVSSSEWPIVIFVGYRDDDQPQLCTNYIRHDYRARSRATAGLIEIFAVRPRSATRRVYRNFSDSHATFGKLLFFFLCVASI